MLLPVAITAALDAQQGVFTTAQAVAAGLTGQELGRLRSRGDLVRLRRGVYTTSSTWAALDSRSRHLLNARAVATRVSAPAVFSHLTAAVAHDLPLHAVRLDEVHLTRPGQPGATRHQAGVCHHAGPVPTTERLAGLEVTRPARTVVDLGRVLEQTSAVVVIDAALARGLDPASLLEELEACRHWPGAAPAARAVALADGRSQSVGETLTRLVCHAVGLPPDDLQLTVRTDRGTYEVDLAWTAHGVVGEFDGKVKYGRLLKPGQSASDVLVAERQRELAIERAGWVVVRFTWAEVHDLALVRRRLLDAFARSAVTVRAG